MARNFMIILRDFKVFLSKGFALSIKNQRKVVSEIKKMKLESSDIFSLIKR